MLTAEQNKLLTEVGLGTPMGNLLRRYWQPIAAVTEFDDQSAKPVRLMGEELVMYKDLSGNYGLLGRHCAHRGADLANGIVEQCGLRCHYHGWHYDASGRCLEQPYDDTVNARGCYKDKIQQTAYPVEAKAGLLWAYLGPQPAPLVPNWEPFTWQNGFRQIVISKIPCNWFQCQENSIDPVHFEWMHENWGSALRGGSSASAPRHLKLAFDEFEYGMVYRRVREGGDEQSELWTVGRVALWPNCFFLGDHFEWRVPVDETTTLSIMWVYNRVPKDREPFEQPRIPHWFGPIADPGTGRWIDSHVVNQDFIAWLGQGPIANRMQEHLGLSDRGVVMMRQRFFAELDAIAKGSEAKGLIRDPQKNACVQLPIIGHEEYLAGTTLAELEANPAYNQATPRIFPYQFGQPLAVRRAYEEAMGFQLQEYSPDALSRR
jgi:5,5'-dehydrodivanillate O-demethylase oxygenase subunit